MSAEDLTIQAGLAQQQAFLDAHPDLYERSHGAVRVRIRDGRLAIGSLDAPGFASGAMPVWDAMRSLPDGWHAG
jgi:hypothetical protein